MEEETVKYIQMKMGEEEGRKLMLSAKEGQ